MKIWLRHLAAMALATAGIAVAGSVLLVELFLSLYAPNVLLQLLLAVGLAVLAIAGWRVILMLYRWAPDGDRSRPDVR